MCVAVVPPEVEVEAGVRSHPVVTRSQAGLQLQGLFRLEPRVMLAQSRRSTVGLDLKVRYERSSCTALAVDCTGEFGVLGSQKGLLLVDLESPYDPMRKIFHQSKWPIGLLKCNPHISHRGYIASTSNNNLLIWNVGENALAFQMKHELIYSLSSQSRSVAWSAPLLALQPIH